MKKIIKKRAGFTLVELLIVIIIIGILAGSMMLVAGSGTDKAEATKIVSNLRSLKSAALLYYADEAGKGTAVAIPAAASLDKYMDRKLADMGEVGTTKMYSIQQGTDAFAANWYVQYTNEHLGAGILAKLKDSKDAGIFSSTAEAALSSATDTILMKAR